VKIVGMVLYIIKKIQRMGTRTGRVVTTVRACLAGRRTLGLPQPFEQEIDIEGSKR